MENNWNYSRRFMEFVSTIGSTEDMFTVSQEAIALIADDLEIGCIRCVLPTIDTCALGQEMECRILYECAERGKDKLDSYRRDYIENKDNIGYLEVLGRFERHVWPEGKRETIMGMVEILCTYIAQKRLNDRVQTNGHFDAMTGLLNPSGLMERGMRCAKQGILNQYTAFYLNIQNMKMINKRFGTKTGDRIIWEVAERLSEAVQKDGIAARLGGDNFAVMVKKVNKNAIVELIEGMEFIVGLEDGMVPLTVKVTAGAYEIEDDVPDMSAVMQRVSTAYRVAKDLVHKDYVVYSHEFEQKIMAEKEVLFRFPTALAKREFQIFYQPKVDTKDMSINGAEALSRWYRDGAIVPPGDFIPVLEKDEKICKLDFYVLERVCEDIRGWIDKGMKPVRVSVNFSRRHLTNPELVKDIIRVLDQYEIPREYIEVEVTETVNEKEYSRLFEIVKQLNKENIYVFIDDFGSGASSLNMLRKMSVDGLKIDRSFIQSAVENEKERILLTNIIRLSQELKVGIVTEGVEKEEQMKLLQDLNCFCVQGFLFDKPLAKEEFEKRMLAGTYDSI